MSKDNLPNLWILENGLVQQQGDFRRGGGGSEVEEEGVLDQAKSKMRRAGESPVRVLETNIDFPPLTVNGDLNKGGGPNGNKRGASVHDHHHHMHLDHDSECGAAPTDTMLSHPAKYRVPADDDDDDDGLQTKGKPGKLQKMAHKHGLTKKGLLLLIFTACVCLVLLVAILVMAVLWPRDLDQMKVEVCLTPACLRASAQVQ